MVSSSVRSLRVWFYSHLYRIAGHVVKNDNCSETEKELFFILKLLRNFIRQLRRLIMNAYAVVISDDLLHESFYSNVNRPTGQFLPASRPCRRRISESSFPLPFPPGTFAVTTHAQKHSICMREVTRSPATPNRKITQWATLSYGLSWVLDL